MKLLHQISILLVAIALSSSVCAQGLTMEGRIREKNTEVDLDNWSITVLQDGREFKSILTENSFFYNFDLDLGYIYSVSWSKAGYITMTVLVDTRNIPLSDQEGGFILNTLCHLPKMVEGFNLEITNEPISKCSFSTESGLLEWDTAYAEMMKARIDAEFKRLEQKTTEQ